MACPRVGSGSGERSGGDPGRDAADIAFLTNHWADLSLTRMEVLAIVDDGTILFANTGFATMLGYTQEEVLTLEFRQIFGEVPPADSGVGN